MELSLKPKVFRLIENELRSGKYASADDLVQAGMAALKQQQSWGDFAPGELDQLIRQGERSIKREGTVAGEEVFADLRRRSQSRHRTS